MNKSVLFYTNINECTEVNHIPYSTLKFHSRFKILELQYILFQKRCWKLIPRIPFRPYECINDILQRKFPDS
ncbi:hypothetical protein AYJ66_17285 [Dietzia cinnamea]|nr:hypothetical protein AYJ66_17285 [Dietzia cinnamea]